MESANKAYLSIDFSSVRTIIRATRLKVGDDRLINLREDTSRYDATRTLRLSNRVACLEHGQEAVPLVPIPIIIPIQEDARSNY